MIHNEQLNMKSTYLMKLKNRKMRMVSKVQDNKAEALVDKVFGRNVMFVRDYSVFAVGPKCGSALLRRNKNCIWDRGYSSCLHIKPDVKIKVKSKSEIEFPFKYNTHNAYKEDGFTKMYKQKLKQQHRNTNINKHKLLKQHYNSHSPLNKINSYKHINNSLISSSLINNNNNSKIFTNGKLKQCYHHHSHVNDGDHSNSYLALIAKRMIIAPFS